MHYGDTKGTENKMSDPPRCWINRVPLYGVDLQSWLKGVSLKHNQLHRKAKFS